LTLIKIGDKIIGLYILISVCRDITQEKKNFELSGSKMYPNLICS